MCDIKIVLDNIMLEKDANGKMILTSHSAADVKVINITTTARKPVHYLWLRHNQNAMRNATPLLTILKRHI